MQPNGVISENPKVLTWLLLSSCYLESQTSEKSAQRFCLHRFMNILFGFFLGPLESPKGQPPASYTPHRLDLMDKAKFRLPG